MQIIPAILELTTEKLIEQIKRVETELPKVKFVHIDIMDGKFVKNKTVIDVKKIMELKTNLKFELHFMVADPMSEMREWINVENVQKVLFHFEADDDQMHVITFARKEGWEVGMVLNPETKLSETEKIIPHLDVLQFMTVHPGNQGALLVPEVLEKIKEFINWRKSHPPLLRGGQGGVTQPLCSVDGDVTKENIGEFKKLGVDVVNVGHALIKAKDLKTAYKELQSKIS